MSDNPVGKLRLYCCGGAGANIGLKFLGHDHGTPGKYQSIVTPVFLDTSKANAKPGMVDENTYYVPKKDGSGGLRAENYPELVEAAKEFINKFKPQDLNLVVFSAAGGSGSTVGPIVVGELLAKGESVIALVIGDGSSTTSANNTLKTLQSLEGVSRTQKHPVCVHYRYNHQGRTKTDHSIETAIAAFSVLGSRQIAELDSMDIFNFLNYQRVTGFKPSLAALEIHGDSDMDDVDALQPIAVIAIRQDTETDGFKHIPAYLKVGFAEGLNLADNGSLTFSIDQYAVPGSWANFLKDRVSTLKEQEAARANIKAISSADEADDNGMVL